ncbi:TPA: nuclear transport factor 2 family protein [Candidatus Woesearchaeota archaeon]|nr:nuclear transport factor 2 family protein [Candidatus Woesearchaeota archaeon]HIH41333.1 nuclear transport factor 2 family protein [Candidatus Woesearchaeota archaeon]
MREKILFLVFIIAAMLVSSCTTKEYSKEYAVKLVQDHANAWKTSDLELLDSVLHEDVVFAYPGRRLNKNQTLEDLIYFREHFSDTEVYINRIIVDGSDVAVEWQFATTEIATGKRQVVSDGIIGELKDGKFIVWKEYLDGRVKTMQANGELAYEEGEEPFPWPNRI